MNVTNETRLLTEDELNDLALTQAAKRIATLVRRLVALDRVPRQDAEEVRQDALARWATIGRPSDPCWLKPTDWRTIKNVVNASRYQSPVGHPDLESWQGDVMRGSVAPLEAADEAAEDIRRSVKTGGVCRADVDRLLADVLLGDPAGQIIYFGQMDRGYSAKQAAQACGLHPCQVSRRWDKWLTIVRSAIGD